MLKALFLGKIQPGKLQMKPTENRVLVQVDKPKNKTDSGIHIKEEWKTLPPIGVVKETGPQVTSIKIGDKVVFERYGSVILEDNMRMCQESHILAIIDES